MALGNDELNAVQRKTLAKLTGHDEGNDEVEAPKCRKFRVGRAGIGNKLDMSHRI